MQFFLTHVDSPFVGLEIGHGCDFVQETRSVWIELVLRLDQLAANPDASRESHVQASMSFSSQHMSHELFR